MNENKERLVPISAKISQDLKIALTKKAGELGVTVSELVGTYIAGGYSGDYSGTENGSDLALEVVTLMQDHFPVLSSADDRTLEADNSQIFEIEELKNKIQELEIKNAEFEAIEENYILLKLSKNYQDDLDHSIDSVQKIMKEDGLNISRDEAIEYLLLHGCSMCEHDTGFLSTDYSIKKVVKKNEKK